MKRPLFLTLFLILLLFTGCSFFREDLSLSYCLPPWPQSWEHRSWDSGFRLVFRTETGDVEEIIYPCLPDDLSARVPRRTNFPILLYPAGGALPAGAVIPRDLDTQGRLCFSWENGWIALLLFRLSPSWEVVEALNVNRLIPEVFRVGEGNPWRVDMEQALRSLSYGQFSVYALSACEDKSITVPSPGGTWAPDNPFMAPVSTNVEGNLEFTNLWEGYHRFHCQEQETVLDLSIEEDSWSVVFRP